MAIASVGNVLRERQIPLMRGFAYPRPKSLEEMTREEFDSMLAEGLLQVKNGNVSPIEGLAEEIKRRHG